MFVLSVCHGVGFSVLLLDMEIVVTFKQTFTPVINCIKRGKQIVYFSVHILSSCRFVYFYVPYALNLCDYTQPKAE